MKILYKQPDQQGVHPWKHCRFNRKQLQVSLTKLAEATRSASAVCQVRALLHGQHPVLWRERRLAGVCWPQDCRLQRIGAALLARAEQLVVKTWRQSDGWE
jgi:hypothetical protein